jgi:hypothetical protein
MAPAAPSRDAFALDRNRRSERGIQKETSRSRAARLWAREGIRCHVFAAFETRRRQGLRAAKQNGEGAHGIADVDRARIVGIAGVETRERSGGIGVEEVDE